MQRYYLMLKFEPESGFFIGKKDKNMAQRPFYAYCMFVWVVYIST